MQKPLKPKENKRFFSLLEVMVALVLLAMAGGVIGMKMQKAVAKKHFHSQLDRMKERFMVAQKMALAMQADWRSVLRREGNEWVLETVCEENFTKMLSPLRISSMEIQFNGKKVEKLAIDFFASGKVSPQGTFLFIHQEEKVKWEMNPLFSRDEGEKEGPEHPSLRK